MAIFFSSDPPICVFSYLGFVSPLELHCIWQTWTAKVILYLPNQYYLSDPINIFAFCAKIRFSAMASSIVGFFLWKWNIVRASKVFVWSIQKYLCNPFKIAFHQAWQEEGCKNIANSAKKYAKSWLDPAVHELFQIWVKIVGFTICFISYSDFSDL